MVSQPGVVEVNRFILKIPQLDPARDNGTYQCAASNIYGTTYTSAEIRVLCELLSKDMVKIDYEDKADVHFKNIFYFPLVASVSCNCV